MTKRLPGLDVKAAMPGRIHAEQFVLHRAAHALFFSPSVAGLRTLGAPALPRAERAAFRRAEAGLRVLDVRDAVTAFVATERDADAVLRRVAGRSSDRDPRTLRTTYVALIVAAEDKAAAARAVAECLWWPMREVGWLDAYSERVAADAKLFDHRPLVSVAAPGVTTHYLATLRLTPDQREDLRRARIPPSLIVLDLPPLDAAAARELVAEALELRGLAPRAPAEV